MYIASLSLLVGTTVIVFFSLFVIQKIIYIFNRCKYEKHFHNASSQYFNVPNDLSAICVNICMKYLHVIVNIFQVIMVRQLCYNEVGIIMI